MSVIYIAPNKMKEIPDSINEIVLKIVSYVRAKLVEKKKAVKK